MDSCGPLTLVLLCLLAVGLLAVVAAAAAALSMASYECLHLSAIALTTTSSLLEATMASFLGKNSGPAAATWLSTLL
jgi:hypothetical protein